MTLNDPLASALSLILNDERIGRSQSVIMPSSKVIKKVLEVMNTNGYIGEFKEEKTSLTVNLLGNINKCGVIKPRYSVKKGQFEKSEERFLLARDVGILIVSTPQGILTHNDVKKKKIGGKLLAYCY